MKVGLIGLGRMGLRHLQVLQEAGLEVIGACDMQESSRQAAQQKGVAAECLFPDAQTMVEAKRPELVVVATTAPSHEAIVLHAVQHGAKAILCEKPMSTSLASCDRMVAACKAAGTRLAINHQMRFMEQYTWAKQITSSAAFGGLSSVTVVAGNFGMGMNGSHYFEMFRYMTDEAPVRVSAMFSADTLSNPRGAQFEDRAGTVRVETASGKRFYMDASTDQGHGMHVTYAGPHGRLDIDELAGRAILVQRLEEHRAQPTSRYGMPWETIEKMITPADAVAPTRAVLDALLAGQNYPDGEIGRKACEVLVAAYVSHERGGAVVDLNAETLPRDRVFPWA